MAIFYQVPRREMGTFYTHLGWLAFCPVYISEPDADEPTLSARNWVPEWVLSTAGMFQVAMIQVIGFFDPNWDPMLKITVTGKITRFRHPDAELSRSGRGSSEHVSGTASPIDLEPRPQVRTTQVSVWRAS